MVSLALKTRPLGFPKLLVSTKATQAGIWPYVGTKDVLVLPAVADLAGLNRLTKKVLTNAAGAILGMVRMPPPPQADAPLVVMSMNGTVTDSGLRVKEFLEGKGYEVVVFHSIGTGGLALEEFVQENEVVMVVEFAVNELNSLLFGGKASAGPDRFLSAGKKGISQIVIPGSADFINFLGPETVPGHYKARRIHSHSQSATLVRTSPGENRELGKALAERLNQSKGKILLLWPSQGLSSLDREGKVFWDKDADQELLRSLRENLKAHIEILEVNAHVNDEVFSENVIKVFHRLLTQ
jgi:uncharacterized protein (UPF0261 family)